MAVPPPLRPGDRVAVAAPASPVVRRALEPGIEVLKSWGLDVLSPEPVFEKTGYLAGPDAERADALNSLIQDPEIKGVFAARGGYGTLRILSRLDFAPLGSSPKLLVGFSDITGLLIAALGRASLMTLHGPTVNTFGGVSGEDLDALRSLAFGEAKAAQAAGLTRLRDGNAQGRLIGGNLTTLVHLLSTPFEPDFSGAILFVEERGEATYRLDRLFTHLREAGKLTELSGLVLGEFFDCGPTSLIEEMVVEVTRGLGLPVAAGLPVGHGARNMPLWMGARAELADGVLRVEP